MTAPVVKTEGKKTMQFMLPKIRPPFSASTPFLKSALRSEWREEQGVSESEIENCKSRDESGSRKLVSSQLALLTVCACYRHSSAEAIRMNALVDVMAQLRFESVCTSKQLLDKLVSGLIVG